MSYSFPWCSYNFLVFLGFSDNSTTNILNFVRFLDSFEKVWGVLGEVLRRFGRRFWEEFENIL